MIQSELIRRVDLLDGNLDAKLGSYSLSKGVIAQCAKNPETVFLDCATVEQRVEQLLDIAEATGVPRFLGGYASDVYTLAPHSLLRPEQLDTMLPIVTKETLPTPKKFFTNTLAGAMLVLINQGDFDASLSPYEMLVTFTPEDLQYFAAHGSHTVLQNRFCDRFNGDSSDCFTSFNRFSAPSLANTMSLFVLAGGEDVYFSQN